MKNLIYLKNDYVSHKLIDLFSKRPDHGLKSRGLPHGKYKYLKQADLKIDSQDIKTFVNDEDILNNEDKHLNKGDVLITLTGNAQSYYFNSDEKVYFEAYLVRYSFDQNLLLSKYFYYWTKTQHFLEPAEIELKSWVYPTLKHTAVSKMEISLPKVALQKKIINIMEPLDRIVNAFKLKKGDLERKIKFYENLIFKNTHLLSKSKDLREICEILKGSSKYTEKYCSENTGKFPVFSSKKNKNIFFAKINSFEFTKNKIFITRKGKHHFSILLSEKNFSITSDCYVLLLKEKNILDKFLFYYLMSLKNSVKGSFKSYLNTLPVENLKNITINFPSLTTQYLIISILEPLYKELNFTKEREDLYKQKYKYYSNLLIR